MERPDAPTPFQHPAVQAASAARNAVSAEMSVAGRSRNAPDDPAWTRAAEQTAGGDDTCWILASEAYARMQWDLACADAAVAARGKVGGASTHRAASDSAGASTGATADAAGADAAATPQQRRARALAELAIPVAASSRAGVRRAIEQTAPRKPAARRRREYLMMAFWFLVGGLGGLVALLAIRGSEVLLAWR
ncbi:MAG: hypothetical protein U0625_08300 [Phycisphaerales bacterium]